MFGKNIASYFGVDISFILTGKMSSDHDPLLERIRMLSPESREELEKFTALLELKEKHGDNTETATNLGI